MSRKIMSLLGVLIVASMILAACATPTPAPTAEQPTQPAVPPTEAPTAAPTATTEPTAVPVTRHGGWLDEIDYSVVDAQSAITQIGAKAIDLFSYGLASNKLADIKAANLCYTQSYGTYYSLIFNPYGDDKNQFKDGRLNPFSGRKMREAINWAVDRNYINQEVYAGGVLPKVTPLTTQLVDYTGVIDVARGLEAYYAYNMDKAKAQVTTEMQAMGATLGSDGKWQYGGKPVEINFLIRNDGDGTRLPMGEYVATQLETLGFTVTRTEKKSSELSPLWIRSDPAEGQWNVYTGGWAANGLSRDEKRQFLDMYLPDSGQGIALFTANKPDPEFQKVGDDLANGNFKTLQERHDMMAKALPLALQDSLQVWLVDLQTYVPFDCSLQVSSDVGAGVETTFMAPYNLRIKGQEGGAVKSGTTATLFTDPWNPVGGSNWVSSAFVENATASRGLMPDPYTGLAWPFRAEKADLVVQTGLPVATNLNWVNLTTADTITVPPDAWADWDAKNQKWITVGEKFPNGVTAKTKSVIYYPADMFKTVKWHDGSNLSVADFVMGMIMTFDIGKQDSPNYDPDLAGNVDAYLSHFKGVQIVSTDPLAIATYDDNYLSDAELDVTSWWPTQSFGEAPWHTLALGNIATGKKELAWSTGMATTNKVEWISFIGGPSLDILSKDLDQAITDKTIPFPTVMGAYLTADDAVARYNNLKAWYTAHGNFWVGSGPYYLAAIDLNGSTAVVKNFADFPDLSDRWAKFGEAPLATAAIDGPAQVKIGADTTFNVTLTTKSGDPYPNADVKELKYILYNDKGSRIVAMSFCEPRSW